MTTIATETKSLSHVVKQELWADLAYCRDVVTARESAGKTYAVGTVLGKITASGKYKIAVETATDGSETPAAVVMADYTIAATTDTSVLALTRGPAVVANITLDASFDDATKVATAKAALKALGIIVRDAV